MRSPRTQTQKMAEVFCRHASTVPRSAYAVKFLALCIVAAASYTIIMGETRLAHAFPRMPIEANRAAFVVGRTPSPFPRRASEVPKLSTNFAEQSGAEAVRQRMLPPSRSYRRVVDLNPHEHLLYQGRQKALCKLMRRVQDEERQRGANPRTGMGNEDGDDKTSNGSERSVKGGVLLNMTTSCVDWGNKRTVGSLGVGNLVLGLYAVRLAATVFGFDLLFRCAEETGDVFASGGAGAVDAIGPFRWMQGHFLASDDDAKGGGRVPLLPPPETGPYRPPLPKRNRTCRGMGHNPVHYMSEHIRNEFRTMAVDIFGPRENLPESARYLKKSAAGAGARSPPAPLAGAPLDDVAIHLRCGDILYNGGSHYGFLPFRSYVTRLGKRSFAGTIGIVTIPFDPEHLRGRDKKGARPCRKIVAALIKYLQTRLPGAAAVNVRNGPDETPAVSMARLVMANTTFCGPTTFGLFPSIASFGTAYVHSGTTNYFIPEVAERYNDVVILDEPILTTTKMKKMSMNETMKWLLGK